MNELLNQFQNDLLKDNPLMGQFNPDLKTIASIMEVCNWKK